MSWSRGGRRGGALRSAARHAPVEVHHPRAAAVVDALRRGPPALAAVAAGSGIAAAVAAVAIAASSVSAAATVAAATAGGARGRSRRALRRAR